MNILDLIAEWRKGCSKAPASNPEECHACTVALIDAIERHERQVEQVAYLLTTRSATRSQRPH